MNRIETFAGGIVIGMILGSYIIGMAVEAQNVSAKNMNMTMSVTATLSEDTLKRLEKAIILNGMACNSNRGQWMDVYLKDLKQLGY